MYSNRNKNFYIVYGIESSSENMQSSPGLLYNNMNVYKHSVMN